MLKSFRNKTLADLWSTGRAAKIDGKLHKRILIRLDAINKATRVEVLNVTGFNFHALKGHNPIRYTIHINGPWCVTFEFEDGHAYRVDFE